MVDFQKRDTRRDRGGGIGTDDEPGGSRDDDTDGDHDGTGEDDDHSDDESHDEHAHHHGPEVGDLGVAVLTVSSSRSLADDASGDAIIAACEDAGWTVVARDLLPDDRDAIRGTVDSLARNEDVDVVVTTGGTGVSPDDVTVEAVVPLFSTVLPGFGELFRRYSEAEIGTRVVATRATAGLVESVPVFCLPGSENAATLGVEEIILPEAGHLVGLARADAVDGTAAGDTE